MSALVEYTIDRPAAPVLVNTCADCFEISAVRWRSLLLRSRNSHIGRSRQWLLLQCRHRPPAASLVGDGSSTPGVVKSIPLLAAEPSSNHRAGAVGQRCQDRRTIWCTGTLTAATRDGQPHAIH